MTTTWDSLDGHATVDYGAALPSRLDVETVPRTEALFRYDREYWTIAFDGQIVRLRDTRGLHYIAHLLRQPNIDVHVSELVELATCAGDSAPALAERTDSLPMPEERARQVVTKGIKRALDRIRAAHPALGSHLRATIRRGYLCTYRPAPRAPIACQT